ncbi:MAG TPA: class I SAM-dependent methyltransferase [Geothermobacteraceae bacterium]|nr:class I SAM-dependent methyltransferase [Geothermobacteraceae bacterium]
MKTEEKNYTERLLRLEPRWKKLLPVQLPYRLHLQSLNLGYVLDLGCGIGRNLLNLEGNGIGVDHNPYSIEVARSRGLTAYTPVDFHRLQQRENRLYDALLCSHVLEHMRQCEALALIREYLPYLRSGGRVVMITPQESGFRSDASHLEFIDFNVLATIATEAGLQVKRSYSFPFPRWIGRFFRHNEFVVIAHKP